MSTQLNAKVFSECLHSKFELQQPGGEPLALELIGVTEHPSSPRQEQFSLMLRGPLQPVLEQRIHAVHHGTLGTLNLFLVPMGPEGGGMSYEVVFNRLRDAAARP